MNDWFSEQLILGEGIGDPTEIISIIPEDDEIQNSLGPDILSIVPLRNTVLFPGVVIPITVGREKSIKAIEEANKTNQSIGVVSQVDESVEDPSFSQVYKIGTLARIAKVFKMPDGNTMVILQGQRRFEIEEEIAEDPIFKAKVRYLSRDEVPKNKSFLALRDSVHDLALKIIEQSPSLPSEASIALKNIHNPVFLINFIAANINADVETKQKLLEESNLEHRATDLLKYMTKELQLLELKNDIQSKVKVDLDKQQKEYFLHQQMKQIQEELGGTPQEEEVNEFRKKAENKKWGKVVQERFDRELGKLQRMNAASAEYSVQVNYLETLTDLPWGNYTKDNFNLNRARKILDRDHFGLDKVKERILEHLAVLKLKGNMKSPILCLYGPPGVGKTSLGKSVAEAIGRKYLRMSLGGLKDESEIRGHRKTYIGAMPGRILQNLKKAKSSNPVFVLDEIDKVGNDFHGDPSSALLEVLDPEQNDSFYDNFLELDYDLSNVLFIATANSLNTIQPALRDRMEIIEINGYTVEEKVEIARKHLLPKLIADHGINKADFQLNKKIIERVVDDYTRESGVRNLEKVLAKIVRYVAKSKVMEEDYDKTINEKTLLEVLGPAHSKDKYQGNDVAGVVTGLAWTPVGGDILFIETSLNPGKGKLTVTGNLGDVMKESAVIALQFIRAHAAQYGLDPEIFNKWDIHVHVPEGATPKDGPSAGITMITSLLSALTQRKVKKALAMSGEITLRGRVLPVGGIQEKILAAKRANIKEIILSVDNEKDILEIKAEYLKGLKFHYVSEMSEVLDIALMNQKVQNPLKIA